MEKNKLGNVEIKPEALAVIVSIATKEIEGVSKLVGNLKNSTLEKIGKKEYTKGIKLFLEDDELYVEISCTVKSGYTISKIATKIQSNVRNSIYNMTDIVVKSINVNIIGIDY
ncbi:Asp23/Gls24 family envelope stress response protein [Gemelliphila asaccharolytica]|uniref:Asp23/Gls24 family envelope stress response protein n=1 Tax=Gemelliphila asaccharolytica TaxID=502393 RepID=A0ABR5TLY8_9BACL|nr:Asp23/Gls24 family envelope stress response protein [Gemella asaccharolytica]KXB58046.1 hypothetical protein HMPREF1871_00712 [Gemella asaccharolytica]